MEPMDRLLNQLVEKLQKAHGKGLRSVILYGSGASGDVHGVYSDLNVMCVLEKIGPKELEASEPVFKWWREKGNPAPLLMSRDEVLTSSDCFPIEYHDIAERHRVLHGEDVTAGLTIDDAFYRAQVEHELRAKLLRLRQKAAGVLSDRDLMLRLMADSVSTFCVLARHALLLSGHSAPWPKREVVSQLREAFGIEGRAFDMLLGLREGQTRPRSLDPGSLFSTYLEEIAALVAVVDRLER